MRSGRPSVLSLDCSIANSANRVYTLSPASRTSFPAEARSRFRSSEISSAAKRDIFLLEFFLKI